jgi:hypothetical protein
VTVFPVGGVFFFYWLIVDIRRGFYLWPGEEPLEDWNDAVDQVFCIARRRDMHHLRNFLNNYLMLECHHSPPSLVGGRRLFLDRNEWDAIHQTTSSSGI